MTGPINSKEILKMAQTAWQFSYSGDPYAAMMEAEKIPGIHGKQLVSLQELILHAISGPTPPATQVKVEASEIVGSVCEIKTKVTFSSVARDGHVTFAPPASDPQSIYEAVGAQKQMEQYLRWSGRNACDEVKLTGAPAMTLSITQEIAGQTTTAEVNYSFPYGPSQKDGE
jgi:hypothetical protein